MTGQLLFLFAWILADQPPPSGAISGFVLNESSGQSAVAGVDVVLRVNVEGEFVIAGETLTNERGRFSFDGIPADPRYVYLAGANWQTIHYPGPRVRLSGDQRYAEVEILVRDVIQSPSPLITRRHDILIEPQQDALRVTETMEIENPMDATYVGQPTKKDGRAATLQLSIPADFRRVTFHSEFFGQRFVIIDDRLVTDIPWTPGTRELAFTYVLPVTDSKRSWERRLDLPSSQVTVRVRSDQGEAGEVVCSLPANSSARHTDVHHFSADGLPASEVIHVHLERLAAPWITWARWGALVLLAGMIGLSIVWHRTRPRLRQPVRPENHQTKKPPHPARAA